MTAKISIDKAGRLVLPKAIRDQMRLSPGDDLVLESEDERITLRPVRARPTLKKELGVWVYQGKASHAGLAEWLDRERESRLEGIAG